MNLVNKYLEFMRLLEMVCFTTVKAENKDKDKFNIDGYRFITDKEYQNYKSKLKKGEKEKYHYIYFLRIDEHEHYRMVCNILNLDFGDVDLRLQNSKIDKEFEYVFSIKVRLNGTYVANSIEVLPFFKELIEVNKYSKEDKASEITDLIGELETILMSKGKIDLLIVNSVVNSILSDKYLKKILANINFQNRDYYISQPKVEENAISFYYEKSITQIMNFIQKPLKDNEYKKSSEVKKQHMVEKLEKYFGIKEVSHTPLTDAEIYKVILPEEISNSMWPDQKHINLNIRQQYAVNKYLNNCKDIFSVNGPPGTGKTTLLKEVFADNIYKKAKYMVLKNLNISFLNEKDNKIKIDPNLLDYAIVVCSNNNAAVQNISDELPAKEAIAEEYQDFQYLSPELLEEYKEKNKLKSSLWGLVSARGGKKDNISNLIGMLLNQESKNVSEEEINIQIDKFNKLEREVEFLKSEFTKELKEYYEKTDEYNELKEQQNNIINEKNILEEEVEDILVNKNREKNILNSIKGDIENVELDLEVVLIGIVNKFKKLIGINKKYNEIYIKKIKLLKDKNEIEQKLRKYEEKNLELIEKLEIKSEEIGEIAVQINLLKGRREELVASFKEKNIKEKEDSDKIEEELTTLKKDTRNRGIQEFSFLKYKPELNKKRKELFFQSLRIMELTFYKNLSNLKAVTSEKQKKNILLTFIPVVSSTLASLPSMLYNYELSPVGNIIMDEAGQATPFSGVIAIAKSKKSLIVGDPFQIKPILTIDNGIFNVMKENKIPEDLKIEVTSSVQTLCDNANPYGMEVNKIWVGAPLVVHNRCQDPMFSISNSTTYDGNMIMASYIGKSSKKYTKIIHVPKEEGNQKHYSTSQYHALKKEFSSLIADGVDLKENIYVISPFKSVVNKLKDSIKKDYFNGSSEFNSNVGTVHTFQGKEAKIIYFITGINVGEEGAITFVVKEPNMINVAVTRAKEEFIFIGDKTLWSNQMYTSEIYKQIPELIEYSTEGDE